MRITKDSERCKVWNFLTYKIKEILSADNHLEGAAAGQYLDTFDKSISFTSTTEITLTPTSLKETLILWAISKNFANFENYVLQDFVIWLIPKFEFLWKAQSWMS